MVLVMLNSCSVFGFTQTGSVPPLGDVVIHRSFSPSVIMTDVPEEMGSGWGVGFVRPEQMSIPPLDRPQTEEFHLSIGENFIPYLILAGNLDESMSILVTVLLDYKQVSFELDGETGTLHELELPPHVELNMPMKLAIDQPGAHDLVVIVFTNPSYRPMDNETRLMELQPALGGRRAVIVVGDVEVPFKKLLSDTVGKPIPQSNSDYLGVALVKMPSGLAEVPPADRQLIVTPVSRDNDFSFQVVAKNEEEEHVEYAMVTFLNFKQVSLDDDGVLLANLDADEEAVFDSRVHIPNITGMHELQVVYIMDPYKSILHKEVMASFVFASLRVGLQAR